MRLLALDPSASCTGWALYEDGTIVKAGFSPPFNGKTEGERYALAYAWLNSLLLRLKTPLDLVLMEGYFFSKRFSTGVNIGPELRGVFKLLLYSLGLTHQTVDPAEWKRRLIEKATPDIIKDLDMPRVRSDASKIVRWKKGLKRKFGKTKSKKLMTTIALTKLFNVELPKKIANKITNRTVNFKFDVSDAIGILVGHLLKQEKTDIKFDIEWDFEVIE